MLSEAHEVVALEVLTLLLENPTDDSVEVAIGFLKECGQKLTDVTPRGVNSIFERLLNVLHEGHVELRVQYMVEVMFAIRKDGFKDHQSVLTDLDLVEEAEQFTHLLQLEDAVKGDEILNIFKEDPNFAENEEKYKSLKKEILDEGSSDEESGESSGSGSSESEDEDNEDEQKEQQRIIDQTETNLVALRRTIYLTVQSSLDHNECAHKMLKMELKPGQEVELCNMVLDCCAQLRTYEKFFGLLAQRFCQLDKKYIDPFQQIFCEQYETIHRLETNKLRNVAKFFSHLLYTDAISWGVLSVVKLTEEDTTSASRIFLKILFQELSEFMGLHKLNERLKDQTLSSFFIGIMPRDSPKNTRFSINFFTTIGLGGLTDSLRDHLKAVTRQIVQQKQDAEQATVVSSNKDNDDSGSSGDDSDSSSESSDSDDSSDSDAKGKKKKKTSSLKSKNKKADESKKKKKGKEKNSGKKKSSSSKKKGLSEKGDGLMNGKRSSPGASGRNTIADRLFSMAQYGNVPDREREGRAEKERHSEDKQRDKSKDKGMAKGDERDTSRDRQKGIPDVCKNRQKSRKEESSDRPRGTEENRRDRKRGRGEELNRQRVEKSRRQDDSRDRGRSEREKKGMDERDRGRYERRGREENTRERNQEGMKMDGDRYRMGKENEPVRQDRRAQASDYFNSKDRSRKDQSESEDSADEQNSRRRAGTEKIRSGTNNRGEERSCARDSDRRKRKKESSSDEEDSDSDSIAGRKKKSTKGSRDAAGVKEKRKRLSQSRSEPKNGTRTNKRKLDEYSSSTDDYSSSENSQSKSKPKSKVATSSLSSTKRKKSASATDSSDSSSTSTDSEDAEKGRRTMKKKPCLYKGR